jgi:hypothetical protein
MIHWVGGVKRVKEDTLDEQAIGVHVVNVFCIVSCGVERAFDIDG